MNRERIRIIKHHPFENVVLGANLKVSLSFERPRIGAADSLLRTTAIYGYVHYPPDEYRASVT